MNINFHYFTIKTLCHAAGFNNTDAQTIAYYSQQVDDFNMYMPICVDTEPPDYLVKHKYVKKLASGLWLLLPHPTGIDFVRSMEKNYRYTTLAPFHFIPAKPFQDIQAQENNRQQYRCIPGCNKQAVLINEIVEEAVNTVKQKKDENSLMQLGMALHTYADTYAHCGFSGLEGWENKAVIKKVHNYNTCKEEIPMPERWLFCTLPSIGHGNAGTAPDLCACKIDLNVQQDKQDTKLSGHITRDNRQWFIQCAREILNILCDCLCASHWEDIRWNNFSAKLLEAMQEPAANEGKKDILKAKWSSYFPEIEYSYEKNKRFFYKEDTICQELQNCIIKHVTDAFFTFNILSYKRAEQTAGTNKLLKEHCVMLEESANKLLYPVNENCPGDIPATNTNQIESKVQPDTWYPKTGLGTIIYTAGFEYYPGLDIICSTYNNAQRMAGYCKAYDNTAMAILAVIDCEPFYFHYAGKEWMLELWKGQYGIETGCEAGIYYRKFGKPETEEEKITGRIYQCVTDEDMLEMAFSLEKDGQELFSRDWTMHWWLTGFKWGVFSEPEELKMIFSVRFPNHEMQQAFIYGGASTPDIKDSSMKYGLTGLGYNYKELDDTSVQICFDKPHSIQPVISSNIKKLTQSANYGMVKEYNKISGKYHIPNNDPDIISEILLKNAGIAEKMLYEKIVHYYNRKLKTPSCNINLI